VKTNDERSTLEIKSRQKRHSIRIRLFISKLDLNLRKKLVNFYIWSLAVYTSENIGNYFNVFVMWYWRRMERTSWTDRVKKEEILHIAKEERNILHSMKQVKLSGLLTFCVGTAF
jgi:hypothetical protein